MSGVLDAWRLGGVTALPYGEISTAATPALCVQDASKFHSSKTLPFPTTTLSTVRLAQSAERTAVNRVAVGTSPTVNGVAVDSSPTDWPEFYSFSIRCLEFYKKLLP